MKTLKIISLLLVALSCLTLRAQNVVRISRTVVDSRDKPAVKISGTVVDSQGKPVANAEVSYYQYADSALLMALPGMELKQHTTTDNTGAYSLSVGQGMANIVVRKTGFAPVWKTLQSTPSAPVEPLTLTAPAVLAGIVVDEKDQPVPNAEVSVFIGLEKYDPNSGRQPNFLSGKKASELFSARTGADGHFRIEGFPTGAQAALDVKAPGRALRPPATPINGLQLPINAGQEDIKLVTDPAASIEGKVVVRDSGAPLAGARVQLMPANNQGWGSPLPDPVQSAADGSFRISGIPASSYRVMTTFTNQPIAPWVAEGVPVTVAAGETARDVKIQAIKGGVVEVTVVGKNDKKGVPGMSVSAYSEEYQQNGTTGPDGIARLRLPPGQFTVFASGRGMSQAQEQATVTDGQTSSVTLELNAPSKITGTVRDPSGAAVANTSISVLPFYGGEQQDVKSDASGHYELTFEKPAWAGMQNQNFYVVARNAERNLAAVHELQDNTTTLDVDLKPAMSISGHVQDAKGNAVTNANVFVMAQMDNSGFTINQRPVPVDEQGRLSVDDLPIGQNYSLFVNAKGYGSANQPMESVDPKADHYNFPALVLKLADRKLAGRVLGTDGKAVPGVNVFMNGEGQPNGNATTDANGRFSFDACEGNVFVSANSQGHNGSTQAMGGDTNIVIRLDSNNRVYSEMNSLKLSGTVYDASGKPASDAHVIVVPAWGMVDSQTTDKDGQYTLHWQDQQGMRNAKYFVLARDVERNLAGIEPIDSKKTEASVHMQPGFSISGSVLDSKGDPLPRANVNLNLRVGNNGGMVDQRPVKVGSDGTFTISALPTGQQYGVYISANGYGSANKAISKAQSQTNSVVQLAAFKLRTADQQIAGKVLDKDGKPLAGAWVFLNGNNQPNGNVRTDGDGHFKFKVCSGTININAQAPNPTGQYGFAQAQVHSGDMNVVVKMGDNNRRGQGPARAHLLKPQPWTLAALNAWPASHKTAVIVLLSAQAMLVLGTAGSVFWTIRRKKT